MRKKNNLCEAHRSFVDSQKQFWQNKYREKSPGDRKNMKKCIEELFSETSSETAIHWQQSYSNAETLGVGQWLEFWIAQWDAAILTSFVHSNFVLEKERA